MLKFWENVCVVKDGMKLTQLLSNSVQLYMVQCPNTNNYYLQIIITISTMPLSKLTFLDFYSSTNTYLVYIDNLILFLKYNFKFLNQTVQILKKQLFSIFKSFEIENLKYINILKKIYKK